MSLRQRLSSKVRSSVRLFLRHRRWLSAVAVGGGEDGAADMAVPPRGEDPEEAVERLQRETADPLS